EKGGRMGLGDQVSVINDFFFFYLFDDRNHGFDHFIGMLSHGGLAAKHYGIGPFKHGIGYVGDFASIWPGAVNHTFHHLGGNDDRSGPVDAFLNDTLLNHRNLLQRKLNTQITPSHHDGIGGEDDFPQMIQRFGLFDFGDDFRGTAFLFKYL